MASPRVMSPVGEWMATGRDLPRFSEDGLSGTCPNTGLALRSLADVPMRYRTRDACAKLFMADDGACSVIYFFATVEKVSKAMRSQKRVVVVGSNAIYVCYQDFLLARCVAIDRIEQLYFPTRDNVHQRWTGLQVQGQHGLGLKFETASVCTEFKNVVCRLYERTQRRTLKDTPTPLAPTGVLDLVKARTWRSTEHVIPLTSVKPDHVDKVREQMRHQETALRAEQLAMEPQVASPIDPDDVKLYMSREATPTPTPASRNYPAATPTPTARQFRDVPHVTPAAESRDISRAVTPAGRQYPNGHAISPAPLRRDAHDHRDLEAVEHTLAERVAANRRRIRGFASVTYGITADRTGLCKVLGLPEPDDCRVVLRPQSPGRSVPRDPILRPKLLDEVHTRHQEVKKAEADVRAALDKATKEAERVEATITGLKVDELRQGVEAAHSVQGETWEAHQNLFSEIRELVQRVEEVGAGTDEATLLLEELGADHKAQMAGISREADEKVAFLTSELDQLRRAIHHARKSTPSHPLPTPDTQPLTDAETHRAALAAEVGALEGHLHTLREDVLLAEAAAAIAPTPALLTPMRPARPAVATPLQDTAEPAPAKQPLPDAPGTPMEILPLDCITGRSAASSPNAGQFFGPRVRAAMESITSFLTPGSADPEPLMVPSATTEGDDPGGKCLPCSASAPSSVADPQGPVVAPPPPSPLTAASGTAPAAPVEDDEAPEAPPSVITPGVAPPPHVLRQLPAQPPPPQASPALPTPASRLSFASPAGPQRREAPVERRAVAAPAEVDFGVVARRERSVSPQNPEQELYDASLQLQEALDRIGELQAVVDEGTTLAQELEQKEMDAQKLEFEIKEMVLKGMAMKKEFGSRMAEVRMQEETLALKMKGVDDRAAVVAARGAEQLAAGRREAEAELLALREEEMRLEDELRRVEEGAQRGAEEVRSYYAPKLAAPFAAPGDGDELRAKVLVVDETIEAVQRELALLDERDAVVRSKFKRSEDSMREQQAALEQKLKAWDPVDDAALITQAQNDLTKLQANMTTLQGSMETFAAQARATRDKHNQRERSLMGRRDDLLKCLQEVTLATVIDLAPPTPAPEELSQPATVTITITRHPVEKWGLSCDGVVVTTVVPGSPVDRAGVQVGMVVVSVDGVAVRERDQIYGAFTCSQGSVEIVVEQMQAA